SIQFGSTLTIADFLLPHILKSYIKKNPETRLNVMVENTTHLISKLKSGDIGFAFIEGYFDKNEFCHHLIQKDEFVLAVSKDS
ncbi:MAG TPA: LysR family transcriptional regulator, partial [Firmicutes bacterium]|nr:LysR family transcriptional regulator [Bacillota bacterium]